MTNPMDEPFDPCVCGRPRRYTGVEVLAFTKKRTYALDLQPCDNENCPRRAGAVEHPGSELSG
ncbi:hypothetical protein ACH4TM_12570 [Streptomyces parvus]|uniref:hypothetical protein n=1 Tax=Streptomyces parvus TaxID=66428 RepID=UPI00332BE065